MNARTLAEYDILYACWLFCTDAHICIRVEPIYIIVDSMSYILLSVEEDYSERKISIKIYVTDRAVTAVRTMIVKGNK